MRAVRVAAIQMHIAAGDLAGNRRRMAELARRALDEGARLVLLPELAACGYDWPRLDALAEPLDGATTEAMAGLAARYRAYVAWGMAEREGPRFYNTLTLAGPDGALVARYRKAHLIPLLREPEHFTPGDEVVVVATDVGVLGLAICYDLRFPGLFQRMASHGAEVLLVAAQWPQARAEHWRVLTVAAALQSLAFLVGANGVGLCCGEALAGRSVVASPWGERVAEAGVAEEILRADVDLDDVAEARRKLPVGQGQRPELYL
jgi:predicted amidohydrolase